LGGAHFGTPGSRTPRAGPRGHLRSGPGHVSGSLAVLPRRWRRFLPDTSPRRGARWHARGDPGSPKRCPDRPPPPPSPGRAEGSVHRQGQRIGLGVRDVRVVPPRGPPRRGRDAAQGHHLQPQGAGGVRLRSVRRRQGRQRARHGRARVGRRWGPAGEATGRRRAQPRIPPVRPPPPRPPPASVPRSAPCSRAGRAWPSGRGQGWTSTSSRSRT